ncbi:MAG: RNA polymerase sigma-70 factor [Niabella sp.]
MSSVLSDSEILRSGEERNFRVLYERYWKDLYQKAIPRLGNPDDAKDVVQDIFVTLWNNRFSIVVADTIKPYLFTALKYAIIKKIERGDARGQVYPLNIENIQKVTFSSEELLHYKQLEKLIDNEVSKLPERMQQVYRLSRNEHLRNSEIANRLNLSEQTVKNILSESLKRLRSKLAQYKFAIFIL